MASDYILFIHGVATRYQNITPSYADKLLALIKQHIQQPPHSIEPIIIYWGDIMDQRERELCREYQASAIWDKLWFKQIREMDLIRFAGDSMLYLSRYSGGKVVDRIAQATAKLKNAASEDSLHVVSHSLGAVIFLDLLFGTRWDELGISGHGSAMAIRDTIYGVSGNSPNPKQGICLRSVSTMGAPIGIFSMLDVERDSAEQSTHDITPRLQQLLEYLQQELKGKRLPWRNFVHPGDPIAGTLEGVLPKLVEESEKYVDVHDVLVPVDVAEESLPDALLTVLAEPLRQSVLAFIQSGVAHQSYWQSEKVAQVIVQLIQQARPQEMGA
jgi:hypothetical protein